MDSLLRSIAQHADVILLTLLLAVALLGVLAFRQRAAMNSMRSIWSSMFDGARGENVERLLLDHLRERMELESKVTSLESRVAELESKVSTAKRHLGSVRYDAFEDVGGAQSFAVALFDDRGDGIILNGITGRTDSRIYCKPILNGKCDRNLSDEEQQAVREATGRARKTVVTP